MKKILLGLFIVVLSSLTLQVVEAGWVNGYYRSDGTYVSGHYRSNPNGLKYDNYSWNRGDDLYNDSYGER